MLSSGNYPGSLVGLIIKSPHAYVRSIVFVLLSRFSLTQIEVISLAHDVVVCPASHGIVRFNDGGLYVSII